MSSAVQLFDVAGRRRSPATLSEFHAGRAPGNTGQRYAADPPTVEEIIAVMRHARHVRYGNRPNGLIVVLWRAGLRINEALSLPETDLEEQRGSVLVRHGKNDRRHLGNSGDQPWGENRDRGQIDAWACRSLRVADSRVRLRADDLVTRLRERVPQAAEGVDALAVGVAGLLIAREKVERVTVVCDLWFSVRGGAARDDRSSRSAAASGSARYRPGGRVRRHVGQHDFGRGEALVGPPQQPLLGAPGCDQASESCPVVQ